jgi:hypothetical protein
MLYAPSATQCEVRNAPGVTLLRIVGSVNGSCSCASCQCGRWLQRSCSCQWRRRGSHCHSSDEQVACSSGDRDLQAAVRGTQCGELGGWVTGGKSKSKRGRREEEGGRRREEEGGGGGRKEKGGGGRREGGGRSPPSPRAAGDAGDGTGGGFLSRGRAG